MVDSGYFRRDRLPERTAFGYLDEGETWRTNIYSVPIVGGPDGGAFTTVKDLMKFWDTLFQNKILSKEHTTILLTPHSQCNNQLHYGCGVWISMINDKIFKYFVMGTDPAVGLHSSVYAKSKIQAHIIGNTEQGTDMIAKGIDELMQ